MNFIRGLFGPNQGNNNNENRILFGTKPIEEGESIRENSYFITLLQNNKIAVINTTGIICIGDKLTLSEKPGKARALKYEQNISTFKMPSIGKVIGLYQQYNRAKILLHID